MKKLPTTPIAIWRYRIEGSTQGLTLDQIETATALAFAAEARGEATCARHVAAQATGGLANCCCRPCSDAREER